MAAILTVLGGLNVTALMAISQSIDSHVQAKHHRGTAYELGLQNGRIEALNERIARVCK